MACYRKCPKHNTYNMITKFNENQMKTIRLRMRTRPMLYNSMLNIKKCFEWMAGYVTLPKDYGYYRVHQKKSSRVDKACLENSSVIIQNCL